MTHHGAPARRSDRLALAAVALVGGLTLLVARWGQDLIAAGAQGVDDVRPDEPGSAGHDDLHGSPV